MKPIPGFSQYMADENGQIYSIRSKKFLKPWPDHNGYLIVGVAGKIRVPVAKLITLAFIGPCPKGLHPEHKNRIRSDNRPENLRYKTKSFNGHNCDRRSQYSDFRGIGFKKEKKRDKPWFARITFEGKSKTRGCFSTAKEAAEAYDSMAKELYGNEALLNFPANLRQVVA